MIKLHNGPDFLELDLAEQELGDLPSRVDAYMTSSVPFGFEFAPSQLVDTVRQDWVRENGR